ncbi:TetR/AcrR family transcriptional regulator [Phreatobacter stygius]|uniref:TetR/AcrR family transcriptional regulator n=1 Tax=Phreatobacter stygius TaxID=1940610 RepID=A0A4D7BK75_9HYPH|nr:TetR/AcrR family transcriptional regulator [Phreatobacter stygius]QCI68162.1 TetR/AcrR family transcriptional regulator [Phreatobacter stygius]
MSDAVIPRASEVGTDAAPEVLDTAKRRQILEGARRVFFDRGFEAASMNDITRAAGVSKGTIYAYFTGKEHLFESLVGLERREQAERLFDLDRTAPSIARELEELGVRLATALCEPESVARIRMVIGVAPRLPEIGRAFYDAGPKVGNARLAAYFADLDAAGRIVFDDPVQAARQFLDLCISEPIRRIIFGLEPIVSKDELRASVQSATAMFLRAYPPRG